MGKRGRLYSPEFKEEAVRLVHSSTERYPVARISRTLSVAEGRRMIRAKAPLVVCLIGVLL